MDSPVMIKFWLVFPNHNLLFVMRMLSRFLGQLVENFFRHFVSALSLHVR